MTSTADIVLFTVSDHETRETQAAFGANPPAVTNGPYRYWDYGEIGGARVVHLVCNMADLAAGKSARAAMAAWQPSLLVALGIAWGAPDKDRAIGDLLLAAPLSDAAYAKISDENGMQPRGDMWPQTDSLQQMVKSCHWDWQAKAPDERRVLRAGRVLSLPTLLDKTALRDELLAAHPGTIGGEMEGRGMVDAAADAKCDWLVLKAVCDWGAEKNVNEAQKNIDQALAAKKSATFLRYAIEQGSGSLAASLRKGHGAASPSSTNTVNITNVERYRLAVAKQCNLHTLVDVNATDAEFPDHARTDQLYVQPDVWVTESDKQPRCGKAPAGDVRDGIELSVPKRAQLKDCLNSSDAKFQRIVLTATSGMGKTTAVNQQVLALAKSSAAPWLMLRLPSFLGIIGALNQRVQAALQNDIASAWTFSIEDAAATAAEVIAELDRAPGVMLFDALDEVPKVERPQVLNALRLFLADRKSAQPNHRVIVTSRPYAYDAELEAEGFLSLSLAPFTPTQIEALIDEYFNRTEVNRPDVAAAMKSQVMQARKLPSQRDYVALLQEPMLATFACMLARESARDGSASSPSSSPLPATRFELFDGVVRLLLEKWEPSRATAETAPLQPMFARHATLHSGRSALRAILEQAAYGLLAQVSDQTSLDHTSKPALTQERLVALADEFMPANLPVRAREVVRWLAERTAFLQLRSEQPTKRYQLHLQLGSFLAAGGLHSHHSDDCEFAEALVKELLRAPESSRQVVTMGLARVREHPRALIAAVSALLEATKAMATATEMVPHSWQEAASFAIAFADAVPPAAWSGDAGKKLNTALEPLRARVLELVNEQKLLASDRSAAVDALGVLGDPRFHGASPRLMRHRVHADRADEPIPGFVRIPAGTFKMGHEAESDNEPRNTTINAAFYIARTLTTVAQYQCFVDSGGYDTVDAVWDTQGITWRSGKFTSEVEEKAYKEWLAHRPAALRSQPWDWSAQLAHPSRPVTGVCWFEARAYARWLDTQTAQIATAEWAALREKGYGVHLPTEEQWERAARAKSLTAAHTQRWPFGDDEAQVKTLANVGQDIDHTSGVGVFPANAIGLYDMAGNAWQWMDNLYSGTSADRYPRVEQHRVLKTDTEVSKCDRPALRGGSWIFGPESASCSYRDRALPDGSFNYFGVRVVLSLAKSEA